MRDILKKYFGFETLRPGQAEIVQTLVRGEDAFVLMPTGGGKSLCYQLPAVILGGMTLVVSPLIALMKDQVDGLRENGISAAFLNSSLEFSEQRAIERDALEGKITLLYVAPERLAQANFRQLLKQLPIKLIAIDEAHCISQWGHDFRPEYRNLQTLRADFPTTPVVALTATATERVRHDIIQELQLERAKVFLSSFNRANLRYVVEPKGDTFNRLLLLLQKYKKTSVIIYCFSRKDTERVAEDLRAEGFSARAYHAGLDTETRRKTQEEFIRDNISIIVATIAFGMGIDKPDVRLVVHYDLPKTIEGYYQETGRAGRDGLPSDCVLYYSYGDLRKHRYFFDEIADEAERAQAEEQLKRMLTYSELNNCRRKFLLAYFGEVTPDASCGNCDNCSDTKAQVDATVISQKVLSAVLKTGERFGGTYIAEVLRGARNQTIRERGHEALSVFGIAKEVRMPELQHIIRTLVGKGFLEKNDGEYPTLRVSAVGRTWLNLRQTLSLPPFVGSVSAERRRESRLRDEETPFDMVLFEELRILRKAIADQAHVPPFVVFSDASLREMCQWFPQSANSFLQVMGVGQEKLRRYGEVFVNTIRTYAQAHGLEELPYRAASIFGKGNKKTGQRPAKKLR